MVIAPDLREKFGWGDEGDIIEVECDGKIVSYLLPPVHNESLMGSLAPYIKRTLPEDEWDKARELAWSEATANEVEPPK